MVGEYRHVTNGTDQWTCPAQLSPPLSARPRPLPLKKKKEIPGTRNSFKPVYFPLVKTQQFSFLFFNNPIILGCYKRTSVPLPLE